MCKKLGFKIFITVLICSIISLSLSIPISAGTPDQSNSSTPPQLPSPPEGFNPLTASDNELATYGFPQRPTDQELLSQWTDAMSHAKYYIKPIIDTLKGLRHEYYNTNNLAGLGVYGQNNKNGNGLVPQYTASRGYWVMPNYSPGYGSTHEIASYWTGIGGIKGSQIIVQAGADANLAYIYHSPSYEFWTENLYNNSPGATYYTTPVINGGNIVYVSVTYGGATSTAFFENYSTGQYNSVVFNTPQYDGTSANFIFEKLLGSYDNIVPDVHFSETSLNWINSAGGSGGGLSTSYNYTQCRQWNTWWIIKSYPKNISNGAFDVVAHY
jgi:hypothetical protein